MQRDKVPLDTRHLSIFVLQDLGKTYDSRNVISQLASAMQQDGNKFLQTLVAYKEYPALCGQLYIRIVGLGHKPNADIVQEIIQLYTYKSAKSMDKFRARFHGHLSEQALLHCIKVFGEADEVGKARLCFLQLISQFHPDYHHVYAMTVWQDALIPHESWRKRTQDVKVDWLMPYIVALLNHTIRGQERRRAFQVTLRGDRTRDLEWAQEAIVAIVSLWKQHHWNTALFPKLISAFSLAREVDYAYTLSMFLQEVESFTAADLLDSLVRDQRWNDAVQLLAKINPFKMVSRTPIDAITALDRQAQTEDIIDTTELKPHYVSSLEDWKHRAQVINRFKWDGDFYTALIHAYGTCGNLQQALKLYEQMVQVSNERLQVEPDSVAGVCGPFGEWSAWKAMKPKSETITAVLHAYIMAGDLPGAEQFLLNASVTTPIKQDAWQLILNSMLSQGEFERAKALVKQFSDGENFAPWLELLHATSKLGMVDQSRVMLKELQAFGINADARMYEALILSIAKAPPGQVDLSRVRDICTDALSKMTPRNETFNVILSAYAHQYASADELFQVLRNMTDFHLQPDLVAFNTLFTHFSGIGDVESSERLRKIFKSAKMVPNHRTQLAWLLEAKKAHRLIETFAQIERPNQYHYSVMLNFFAKNGDFQQCQQYFDQMQLQQIRPNSVNWTNLIEAYGRGKQGAMALDAWNQMTSVGLHTANTGAFSVVLDAMKFSKMWDQGRRVWDEYREKLRANHRLPHPNDYTSIGELWMAGEDWGKVFHLLFVTMRDDGIVPDEKLLKQVATLIPLRLVGELDDKLTHVWPDAYASNPMVQSLIRSAVKEYAKSK
jgi:pentatricopeptide repeat protein